MRLIFKIIAVAALFALVLSFPVLAAPEEDLKTQIEEKNQEIQKLEAEIKEFQDNIEETAETAKTLQGEIKRLDKEIKNLNTQIALTQKKIAKKELEIKELGKNIIDTGKGIYERQKFLADILQKIDRIETSGPLELFFKFNSISDFFGELEKIETLEKSVKEAHDQLRALKFDLENRKLKAEAAQKDLKRLRSELLVQKDIEEDGKIEKANLLKATKNQEALYQKLLKDREKRRAEIYEEIRDIENELKKQIDFGSLPSFRAGLFLKPIDGGAVTQEFGITSFSKKNTDVYGSNAFHNGVDFRAPVGTPVRAAEDGIIKATGNSDFICPRGSYGKWVLIEHPNKLATLYAHLSLVRVSPRQELRRGDIIGYSGNSGYSTGPHLHFTVYDARTVQLRKSRVCGTLPYGGYLNPLNYL